MPNKYGTFTSDFLSAVGEATGFFSWPPEGSGPWFDQYYRRRKYAKDVSYRLKKQGYIQEINKAGKKFFKLTSKGELELLMQKAVVNQVKKWDGLWRILVFDIPEDCREKRSLLRYLLNKNNFIKLQASVFISPYPLNREAIGYLKKSGLISYIRIIRANEIDDDRDLIKKFGLKKGYLSK